MGEVVCFKTRRPWFLESEPETPPFNLRETMDMVERYMGESSDIHESEAIIIAPMASGDMVIIPFNQDITMPEMALMLSKALQKIERSIAMEKIDDSDPS